MALTNINRDCRFTKYLINLKTFDSKPFSVVDVGARGGFESHWSIYDDQIRLVGFETDLEEFNKLIQQDPNTNNHYFSVALGQKIGRQTFYVTAYPSSSGFYQSDMNFWRRFPDELNVDTVNTIEVDTVDFDSLAINNHIDYVDFIKLDTEGSELDILKGTIVTLKKSVIGLSIEVEFPQSHIGQPVFSDVDSFLRGLGFILYDLSYYRHSKKALPEPRWLGQVPGATNRGQILWGQALYLRDAVNEINYSNNIEDGWNDLNILKLASFFELHTLPDCAIELLQVARQKSFLGSLDTDHLIDLLVPRTVNKTFSRYWVTKKKELSYSEYMEKIAIVGSLNVPSIRNHIFPIQIVPQSIRHLIRICLTQIRNSIEKVLIF